MSSTIRMRAVAVGVLGLAAGMLSVCSEGPQIELTYIRQVEIPPQSSRGWPSRNLSAPNAPTADWDR